MTNQLFIKATIALICLIFALIPDTAFATVESQGVLNDILQRFHNEAKNWGVYIKERATWLFWALALISMVITFGFMALRKADIAEFFAEFVKFILFVGFFWWLLLSSGGNDGGMPMDIIVSMMTIGGNASGMSGKLPLPSSIVDIGFITFGRALASFELWEIADSLVAAVCALAILILTALIAINMMLLLVSAWILAYAGIFFLGFGGSKWTSDMALNYYKTVLGLGVQLMAMVLLVGIGRNIIFEFTNDLSTEVNINEYVILVVVCLTLFILSNKIPQMLSGIITGAGIGNSGIGSYGAGAAVGAIAGAGAAVAAGASAIQSMVTQVGGAGSAIAAAFKEAQQHMQTGTGMFSGGSSSPGGSAAGGDFSSFGSTMSNPTSAIKAATTFAADMAANLGKGVAATAREAVANQMDNVKEAIAGSVGGQIASEIQNPGEARQERHDNQAIAAAEAMQQSTERKDRAADAREFLAAKTTSMGAESQQPTNSQPTQPVNDEVSAFVNKGKSGD